MGVVYSSAITTPARTTSASHPASRPIIFADGGGGGGEAAATRTYEFRRGDCCSVGACMGAFSNGTVAPLPRIYTYITHTR